MAELSDVELRKQLIAHGEKSIGPITESTRAIYRKKLNHLKAAERKASKGRSSAETSRKLTALSSDDSEGEVESRTSAPARGRKSRSTRGKGRGSSRAQPPEPAAPAVRRPAPRRSLRSRGSFVPDPEPVQDESTEEDDEEEEESSKPASFSSSIFSNSSRAGPSMASAGLQVSLNNTLGLSRYDQPDSIEVSDSDLDPGGNEDDYGQSSPTSRSLNTSPRSDDDSFFNRTWSRWMGNGDGREDGKVPKPRSTSTPEVGRLLRHRKSFGDNNAAQNNVPSRQRTSLRTDSSKFAVNNVSNHVGNHHYPKTSRHRDQSALLSEDEMEREFRTEEEPSSFSYTFISKVLILILVLFFLILLLVYLAISGPSIDSQNNRWLIEGKIEGEDYFTEEKIDNARELISEMYELLSTRAGEFVCGSAAINTITKRFMKNYFKNKYGSDKFGVGTKHDYSLEIAMKHISENPHWSIRMLDVSGAETNITDEVTSFVSDSPSLNLWCRFKRSAEKIIWNTLFWIMSMAVVLGIVFLGYRMHKWRKEQKEKEWQRVCELVEQIIDILKSHSDSCQDKDQEPFMAIPHVRDMLIPPRERRKMQGLWDKARDFLSANESRIREETQKISGEEFEVWRWLPACANGGKVWQGQAFGENKESGMNYPTYSLTPCLKIRNMFDADMECEEDWHVRIQDAILEKCPRESGILHIAVDKNSKEGCVYVKCLSAEHAGKCYKALHGWWFDGSLVTVKYLRLERYHQRFPQAENARRPLVPSNNERRSLSQPFHRSIIESS